MGGEGITHYGNGKCVVQKTEGKRLLGQPRRSQKLKNKTDLEESGYENIDQIQLAGFCECGNEYSMHH